MVLTCDQTVLLDLKKNKQKPEALKAVVPKLFPTVAHFHLENFPWPYS